MLWWRARLMKPWQAQFLAYLGKTANVSAAARFAGQPRSVVYEYRKREAAFAAAWLQALEEAADRLEMEVLRRAVDGVKEDKFYQGAVVGEFTRYSDNLLMFLLKARRPALFNSQMAARQCGEEDDDEAAGAATEEQVINQLRRRMESLRASHEPAGDRGISEKAEPSGSDDSAV